MPVLFDRVFFYWKGGRIVKQTNNQLLAEYARYVQSTKYIEKDKDRTVPVRY